MGAPIFPVPAGIFAGMTKEQLVAARDSAQAALLALMSGGRVAEASYTQGDGQRSVRYTQASMADLRQFIGQLNAALTGMPWRRAIGVRFR